MDACPYSKIRFFYFSIVFIIYIYIYNISNIKISKHINEIHYLPSKNTKPVMKKSNNDLEIYLFE